MPNVDMIFDNGGGITLQAPDYCHHYQDPHQAAQDAAALLFDPTANPREWEGNEPEHRLTYDFDTERNGGYTWLTAADVLDITDNMNPRVRHRWLEQQSGLALRTFFTHLFELRDQADE